MNSTNKITIITLIIATIIIPFLHKNKKLTTTQKINKQTVHYKKITKQHKRKKIPIPHTQKKYTHTPAPSPTHQPQTKQPTIINNEQIISCQDQQQMQDIIQLLQQHKNNFTILDTINQQYTIRIKTTTKEKLQQLLNKHNIKPTILQNLPIQIPRPPQPNTTSNIQNYRAFKNQFNNWLECPKNPQWGKDITIAIIDTGILPHKSLNLKKLSCIDLTKDDPQQPPNPHATAIASIIAGNNQQIQGIAQGVELLSIKTLNNDGTGDIFTLSKAIYTAVENGANIINLSLGSYANSPTLEDAVNYALDHNVLLVAATGNDGIKQIAYPARYPGVIAVGAVDANENHLSFSNSSPEVDISAPGYKVYCAGLDDQYINISGTSIATPFVTATLAGIISDNPTITTKQAKELLFQYSNDSGEMGFDPKYGNGILNIGRILNKDKKYFDIATAGFQIKPDPKDNNLLQIITTSQNRGTKTITNPKLKLTINNKQYNYTLPKLNPGEVTEIITKIPKKIVQKQPISIICNSTTKQDQNHNNDTKKIKIETNQKK